MGLRLDAKGFMRDSNTSEADSWEVRLERSCGFSGPSEIRETRRCETWG